MAPILPHGGLKVALSSPCYGGDNFSKPVTSPTCTPIDKSQLVVCIPKPTDLPKDWSFQDKFSIDGIQGSLDEGHFVRSNIEKKPVKSGQKQFAAEENDCEEGVGAVEHDDDFEKEDGGDKAKAMEEGERSLTVLRHLIRIFFLDTLGEISLFRSLCCLLPNICHASFRNAVNAFCVRMRRKLFEDTTRHNLASETYVLHRRKRKAVIVLYSSCDVRVLSTLLYVKFAFAFVSNSEANVYSCLVAVQHRVTYHHRVLARPKWQGAAPCLVRRPVVFSVPCHFSRALWFRRAFISVILSLKLQKASS